MTSIPNEGDLVRYLLGRMPEEEREALERLYFGEGELFERLLSAEAELADAFVRGELPEEDHVAFEERLRASPLLKERERFAHALLAHENARNVDRTAGMRSALAPRLALAAAAVLVLGAGLFATEALRLRGERERLLAERARLEAEVLRLDGEAGAQKEQPSAPRIRAFSLVPGLLRGAGASNRIAVPGDVDVVRLDLRLDGPLRASYEATIRRVTGDVVARVRGVHPSGDTVPVPVDRASLPPGDYILTLEGARSGGGSETVEELAFRVARGD